LIQVQVVVADQTHMMDAIISFSQMLITVDWNGEMKKFPI
jgi:uncharacterized SAM-binding protein YcdF (DUF218 family)